MAREIIKQYVDLNEPGTKRRLMMLIGSLRGLYDLTLRPRRATKTTAQLGYYYGVVIEEFQDFMRDQGQFYTADELHVFLKRRLLARDVVDPTTGEVIGDTLPSVRDFDIAQMSDFIDKSVQFLSDRMNIVIPPPSQYREEKAA